MNDAQKMPAVQNVALSDLFLAFDTSQDVTDQLRVMLHQAQQGVAIDKGELEKNVITMRTAYRRAFTLVGRG